MEAKRLIPYSVHLREDVYTKLKAAAKDRKATALVRDAITMIVEGDDAFTSGYKKALRDVVDLLRQDTWCKAVGIHGEPFADRLAVAVSNMAPKGKPHAKK